MTPRIRIGTRGSALALAQSGMVRAQLLAANPALAPEDVELVTVITTGDRETRGPLMEIGGKGLFTKELEEGLLSGVLDMAVHSMKDMPTVIPGGLAMAAVPKREDPREALISHGGIAFEQLPKGATFATSSLRRGCQIRHLRPDMTLVPLRGNVPTRLRRIREGGAHATLLALAGLKRLGLAHEADAIMPVDTLLPAAAQGALALQTRADDTRMMTLLSALDDVDTHAAVTCERALLDTLDGSCRTAIAALAEVSGGIITLRGEVYAPDGSARYTVQRTGAAADALRLGRDAGDELKRLKGG